MVVLKLLLDNVEKIKGVMSQGMPQGHNLKLTLDTLELNDYKQKKRP